VTATLAPAPRPQAQPVVGHLGRWGRDPLALLEEGARLGPVFGLRLWRSAVVGYSSDWNRFVLGDLTTFRSRGSLSGLSPHLAAGVVQTDGPAHRERRRELNPSFARRRLLALQPVIRSTVQANLPVGTFEAAQWSSVMVRKILSAVFFDDRLPAGLLEAFLSPLDRALPRPFLRRPLLFARMNRALRQVLPTLAPDCLGAAFRDMSGGVDEVRVAVSAAYDTTAHTLAWVLYHAAIEPELMAPDRCDDLVNEVLRMYPAGWLGSRRCATDTTFDSGTLKRGTLLMYSPYLTHRDPTLWADPLAFRPERFREPLPAWGYIPFAAGERSCLGSSLARLILTTAAETFGGGGLSLVSGDPRPRAGITLAPAGALHLHRSAT
jgi:cytochrome P450